MVRLRLVAWPRAWALVVPPGALTATVQVLCAAGADVQARQNRALSAAANRAPMTNHGGTLR